MSSISKVDRKSKKLLSSIEIMPASNADSDLRHIKTETVTTEDLEVEFREECNRNYEYEVEILEVEEPNIKMEKENVNKQSMDCSTDKCDGEWETELNNDRPVMIVVEEKKTRKNNFKNKRHKTKEGVILNKTKSKKASNTFKADKRKGGLPKRTPLDPKHWLKISLEENEALDNFKQRAEDPKYLKAIYKCESCYTTFSTQEIMDRHMKLNHCEVKLTKLLSN